MNDWYSAVSYLITRLTSNRLFLSSTRGTYNSNTGIHSPYHLSVDYIKSDELEWCESNSCVLFGLITCNVFTMYTHLSFMSTIFNMKWPIAPSYWKDGRMNCGMRMMSYLQLLSGGTNMVVHMHILGLVWYHKHMGSNVLQTGRVVMLLVSLLSTPLHTLCSLLTMG